MLIKIKRDSGYVDKIREYDVIIDGEAVGKINNGEEVEIDVLPGSHQLYLKIDWCRSNIIEFEVKEKVIEFECGSNLRGGKFWIPFSELLYITFKRSQYLWIRMKN